MAGKAGIITVGITGCTRSGKSRISAALKEELATSGTPAAVVGQDGFWERPHQVKVDRGGKTVSRMSQEEPECTNHKKFAARILQQKRQFQVVGLIRLLALWRSRSCWLVLVCFGKSSAWLPVP